MFSNGNSFDFSDGHAYGAAPGEGTGDGRRPGQLVVAVRRDRVAAAVNDWRTSSFSESGNCIEAASDAGTVLVRDTRNPDGPVVRFPAEAWRVFGDSLARGKCSNANTRRG